jgi:hypothetical protein
MVRGVENQIYLLGVVLVLWTMRIWGIGWGGIQKKVDILREKY